MPTSTPPPKQTNRQLLWRFWAYARPDAPWLWLGLVAAPLGSLAGLAQPWLIKQAIDGPIQRAVATQPVGATSVDLGEASPLSFSIAQLGQGWPLSTIALLFLLASLAEYLLRGGQLFALQHLGYRALQRLRRGIYRHVMSQGLGFFDQRARGSLLSRSTNDVEAIGEILGFGIVGVVGDVFSIVGIIGTMLWLDMRLTLVSLLVAPLVVGIVNLFRRRLRRYSVAIRVAMAEATGQFSEALSGQRIVQLFGREKQTLKEYKALNYAYLRAYHRANWFDASLYAIMDGVAGLCVALLIWYGSQRYLEGSVTIGLLFAFIQYIQRLFIPVRELSGKVATIERAMASLERIFALMDVDERPPSGDFAPQEVRGAIELRRLRFRYRPEAADVLHGLSLQIRAGEVVALVGPTGSGKSTIGKLLTRMYAAPRETLFLDGAALETWQLYALRRAIGVVQQDVTLFSGSIRDNVTLGRADLDDAAVLSALQRARLAARVERLGGLDATLTEGGGNLSAGERQLLSIARVLAADPPLVILDEATASIDSLTERDVQLALDAVFQDRTVVVVAHRLSTIRKADRIVVLAAGAIVEQGDHDELIALGGTYAQLVAQGELLTESTPAQDDSSGLRPKQT